MLRLILLSIFFSINLFSQMIYHGGPVLVNATTVYPIFYGTWAEPDKEVVRVFIRALNNSTWLQPATTYYNSSGQHIQNIIILGPEYSDYSQGNYLTSLQVANLVKNAVNTGSLPFDPNGVYSVFGAPGITTQLGGGWHFALGDLGTGTQGLWAGSLAVMSHELIETMTDPYGTSWYTSAGYECADICGYGRTKLGGIEYQIANYAVPNGGCVVFSVSNPPPPPPPPPPCIPRGKSGKCR